MKTEKIALTSMGKLYSIKEIQDDLKCSRTKVYKILHSNGFPKIKIGRQYYIPEKHYREWLERNVNAIVLF